ncbi:MAG: hypothetical protein JWO97_3509 [Acidobacteria bacterium]|nr:hypothetical protein [Acidobacteriota bacterium]
MIAQPQRSSTFAAIAFAIFLPSSSALAQVPEAPKDEPPHDINMVDEAPISGAIAVPITERDRKRLRKYEIPELVGSRQALGSQLIDGELPKPIVDYRVHSSDVDQRLSIFEGGLVVINITGAGATMRKKVIIPADALHNYLVKLSPDALQMMAQRELVDPARNRRGSLRIYDGEHQPVERLFDPMSALPKPLADLVLPLDDLLRAITEDRTVTNSVAKYEPRVGDRLVGDDQKIYRIDRVKGEGEDAVVLLHCEGQPTSMYIAKKDLANYFIGKPRGTTKE